MDILLAVADARYKAARQEPGVQGPVDQVIAAGSAALDHYRSLAPAVARTIQDGKVIECRYLVWDSVQEYSRLAVPDIRKLREKIKGLAIGLTQFTATPESVVEAHAACVDWWKKKVAHSEQGRAAWRATASLPSATAKMRQEEEATLRLATGSVVHSKLVYLQSRIDLARAKIEPQASTFDAPVREILMVENGRVRLLEAFSGDVLPAFLSTQNAVLSSGGHPLDADHCAVLEGVIERLSEFASELQVIRTALNDHQTSADLPLELLSQIVEGAWIVGHEVMHLLELQPKPPAVALPPDAGAVIPAETAGKAAMTEGTAARKKGKGNHKPAAGAGSSAAGRPEPQVVAAVSDSAQAAKVLVRSDLGTKKLVSASEAHATASATGENLAIWRDPPSMKVLTPRLERLDELLQFDLPGQQRTVSQARQMKPEDAEHAVATVIKRLQTQATEMQACLAALEEPRQRVLLTPEQIREAHDKIGQLKLMLSGAQGLAKALDSGKAASSIDCMKTYPFPSQNYLEHLRAAEELEPADRPRALKGEPGSLFEIRLQPKVLRNRAMPSPMWVHIHTNRPVHATQLAMLDDAAFAACHVKSNEQRGHNRQWQDARAAIGHENVVIHRGKLTPAFCKSLLTT
ncbi:conserved hypothetical protein [Mesorhizobium prunaredense]|uniref:Uncharacterized protein n=1 Tax=Mesorhizobium prunaredense TaxID=1631249 RepID=A0A1R3V677_9HYPH|nr:hypothetical protein [Mesorhizobium prunaredense]SIT54748.1 conserved hypothetical protein [Mesorhizobium prunaredense]